jgi:leucyl aminopeptidase
MDQANLNSVFFAAFAGAANAVTVMATIARAATNLDVFCIVPILQNEW